jgi:hypothetical protein
MAQIWRISSHRRIGFLPSTKGQLLMLTANRAYQLAVCVALGASLMLVWLSLGVGIIGADGDPANIMYFGVIAVGIAGALIARFRPSGMARALIAMAIAQALVAAVALIAQLGLPWSGPAEIILLNGFFVVVFAGAAWLFMQSARESTIRGSA